MRSWLSNGQRQPQDPAPQRTDKLMTLKILDEFLEALHRCWDGAQYAIIGGAALMKYGSDRQTSHVDVLVTYDAVDALILRLNKTRFVRTADRRGYYYGYKASDGECYGLILRSDSHIALGFNEGGQVCKRPGSKAQIMNLDWLLNSKAKLYSTRRTMVDMEKDTHDILFIIRYMRFWGTRPRRGRCKYVVADQFWIHFTFRNDGAARKLIQIGLERDRLPCKKKSPMAGSGGQDDGAALSRVDHRPVADSAGQGQGCSSGGCSK